MHGLKGLKVDIENEETGEVIESFFIRKMNISASARRYALYNKIKAEKHNDEKFNHLIYCANVSVVLCDVDGNLLYPETDIDNDNGYLDIYNNFDDTIFFLLAEAYSEANPIKGTLKSKKKKF